MFYRIRSLLDFFSFFVASVCLLVHRYLSVLILECLGIIWGQRNFNRALWGSMNFDAECDEVCRAVAAYMFGHVCSVKCFFLLLLALLCV